MKCLWCGEGGVSRTGVIRDSRRGHEERWGCGLCGIRWALMWKGRRPGKKPMIMYRVAVKGVNVTGDWVLVPEGCMLVKGEL